MVKADEVMKYIDFFNQKEFNWDFGNDILYRMCREYPYHDKEDVIIGKIWLIGRSYAAAIERRKEKDNYQSDDFYYDIVGPHMKNIGDKLDKEIKKLSDEKELVEKDIELMLKLHKFLIDAFYEMTKMEKRSLASKYLHFHCPNKFYIFDSRAQRAISNLVKKPDKTILSNINDYDKEYADFVCKMWELQKYFRDNLGEYENPRRLDYFLLYYDRYK